VKGFGNIIIIRENGFIWALTAEQTDIIRIMMM